MEPPVGTVTMLFTDIEGSTRLARRVGSDWPAVLAVHHGILQAAIEQNRGYVADTEGDGFFACFQRAEDAIAAAMDAQRELADMPWPAGVNEVRVRMGMHTGFVEHGELGYVGLEIHRAARVGAAANGGQALVTASTQALLKGGEQSLEYVGEHRLKDFPHPAQLFHLVIDGRRAADFPPLRTAVARPTNLREDLRPLIGRDRELDELRDLIGGGERLVTVVGAGGAGKTRLALAAARLMLDEMPGGAFVAALASVTDPEELVGTLANALGLRDVDGTPAEQIAAYVRGRPTLLVLDNFEQLLPAAPLVSELVVGAPELRVVVTSQASLRVAGEVMVGLDALEQDAAVELFTQLAWGAGSTPVLGVGEGDAILEICRRVGCLPLAIELAAPRVSVLAPKELLGRLEHSSDVLRGVARDAPERQRSLRATFEWTYDLLQPGERLLFRRLGVFAGPVALGTIESVCEASEGDDPLSVLDALEGLLEFSLVRREEGVTRATRFTMPQALRHFARSELEASPEAQTIRRRHAEAVLAVAKDARVWFTADSAARSRVLAVETEIRPALSWAGEHDAELQRRLLAALALGLIRRGHVKEALDRTTHACAEFEASGDEIDAWLANCKAYALLMSGRLDDGEAAIEPVIAFYRARGDAIGLGLALHTAGWLAADRDDRERALALGRESLELLRSSGDPALAGRGRMFLTQLLIDTNPAEAEELLQETAAAITDPESDLASAVTTMRGDLALARGATAVALAHFAESMKLAVRRQDVIQIINDAHFIAFSLASGGQYEAALEAEGVAVAMAAEGGHSAKYPHAEMQIERARQACGPAAAQIVGLGGEIPPGARVPRLLELASTSPGQPPT